MQLRRTWGFDTHQGFDMGNATPQAAPRAAMQHLDLHTQTHTLLKLPPCVSSLLLILILIRPSVRPT